MRGWAGAVAVLFARWALFTRSKLFARAIFVTVDARGPRWTRRSWLGSRHRDALVDRRRVGVELFRGKLALVDKPGDGARLGTDDAPAFHQLHEPRRVLAAADDGRFRLADETLAAAGGAAPLAADVGRDVKAWAAHGVFVLEAPRLLRAAGVLCVCAWAHDGEAIGLDGGNFFTTRITS